MQNPMEQRRAAALAELDVLDAPTEELFDRVVTLAASLTQRSIAAVSLSDVSRQFFLSEVGVGVSEVPRDVAFCRVAVDGDAGGTEIPDTLEDERFRANPLVVHDPGIRTYAGVPLLTDDGVSVGTLCVMDTSPGTLTIEQRTALKTLADVVAQLLVTRKIARDLASSVEERDLALERQRVAMTQLSATFYGAATGLVLTDSIGMVQRVNRAFVSLAGGDETDYVGRAWAELISAGDRDSERAHFDDLHHSRRTAFVREVTLSRAHGVPSLVLAESTPAYRSDGSIVNVLTRIEDITDRRQAEIELRESQSALDGIITVDGNECIVSWNEGAIRLLGHGRQAAMGKNLSLIVPDYAHESHATGFARLHSGGEPRLLGKTVELEALTAAGSLLPIELSLSRWYRGNEPFYTAVIRDVSERKKHEAEQAWRTRHDAATGLPNMGELGRWFDEHTTDLPDGRLRAVFCFQLTNLSSVSAALGAAASAELAREIGERLAAAGQQEDLTVCHLRDTHFGGAVVMDEDPHPAALADRLTALARYVIEAGTGPYVVDGISVEMHVQIGVVATGRPELAFLELLRQAEAIRDSSARQINIADEIFAATSPTAIRDLVTLSELGDAVYGGQLELHYQPLTGLQPSPVSWDGRTAAPGPASVEALLRWRHPKRGLIPPGEFIALAESNRIIFAMTDWVLREALNQQTRWAEAGLDVRVAVNVSPNVLLNDDVVAMVRAALYDTGAAANRLKIEITESAIVDDPEQARRIVVRLRQLGVHVSLDDFGTGYTSLRLLRDLAVDEIKLDRLFVANATLNPADAAIANAVGQLGQRLGIRTVAEGIEEPETRSLFRALGYDYMQGYLDSRPLPADMAATWLREHSSEDDAPGSGLDPTRSPTLILD